MELTRYGASCVVLLGTGFSKFVFCNVQLPKKHLDLVEEIGGRGVRYGPCSMV